MTEQWQELKETIIELRDSDGTGTQQEVCKFLVNYMDILEEQMQEPKIKKVIKMREATPEERESIEKYVKSISKPTGVDFWSLEQEPCEDAISREKAKQFLYERLDRLNDDELYDIFSRIIDDMYNELPSVKPQEKIGHWIRGHHGFGCSNCHKSIEGKWDDNIDDITGTLFCPNCGARMESEGE